MIYFKTKFIVLAVLYSLLVSFIFASFFAFADSVPISPVYSGSVQKQQKENNLTPILLLNAMQQAITTSNYQFYFYTEDDFLSLNDTNTFFYEHRYAADNEQARLTNQDGIEKNIILNHQVVSYFQKDSMPFSLTGRYIVDVFPDILYSDFSTLSQYYRFNFVGKSRVANKMAQIIQLMPKQNDRYSYLLWIDETSALPLRIDLLDLNSKTIHQFKVIQLLTDMPLNNLKQDIGEMNFPIAISEDPSTIEPPFKWQLNWLPDGFQEKSSSNFYYGSNELNSKLYSDGAFSFSLTVSDKLENNNEIGIEGITSIYATNKENKNIVIIGSLPLSTLKKIVDHLSF